MHFVVKVDGGPNNPDLRGTIRAGSYHEADLARAALDRALGAEAFVEVCVALHIGSGKAQRTILAPLGTILDAAAAVRKEVE